MTTLNSHSDAIDFLRERLPSSLPVDPQAKAYLDALVNDSAHRLIQESSRADEAGRNMDVFASQILAEGRNGTLNVAQLEQLHLRLCPLFPICKG